MSGHLGSSSYNPALLIRTLQDLHFFLFKLHTNCNENLSTRIPFKYINLLNFRTFNLLPLFVKFYLIIKVTERKS